MKTQRRWMQWVLAATAGDTIDKIMDLPWHRGSTRAACIARRSAPLRAHA